MKKLIPAIAFILLAAAGVKVATGPRYEPVPRSTHRATSSKASADAGGPCFAARGSTDVTESSTASSTEGSTSQPPSGSAASTGAQRPPLTTQDTPPQTPPQSPSQSPPQSPPPLSMLEKNATVHKQRYTFECTAALDACSPGGGAGVPLAIVVVFSAPGNADRRHAIRRTWGSQAAASNAKVVFLLAYVLDGQLRERLRLEAAEHADLIATPNFVDSYDLLTVKSVAMLQWARDACAHARYLVKVDDDVYLSLPNLARALHGLGEGNGDSGRVMLGSRRDGLKVIRNPKDKWYNPLYLKHYGDTYPTYLSGTAYVIAMSIVGQLYDASQLLPYDLMEDVFVTGLCADRVGGVRRVNHKGFYVYTRGACDFADPDVLTSHEVTPEGMLSVWSRLQEGRC